MKTTLSKGLCLISLAIGLVRSNEPLLFQPGDRSICGW